VSVAPRLSAVVPVYNEADNLRALDAELRRAVAAFDPAEIIYVDDGSTDGSFEVLSELAAAGRGAPVATRVVRLRRNFGQTAALAAGFERSRGEVIVALDGDGQNDPADLLKLLTLARSGPAPAGLYTGHRTSRRDSRVRILSSRIANGVRSRLLRDRVLDTGCGIKLLRREVFLSLPYFDHMHRFLPALVRREGLEVVAVPVSHRHRLAGASKYGVGNRLWVGIVDMIGVMWLQRRRRRPGPIEEAGHHGS
jgi:dolichol-phosphate mannosyltransferase